MTKNEPVSLDDCKWLASIGLPQGDMEHGDKYWQKNCRGEWHYWIYPDHELFDMGEYYLIPSLEDLMAFAKTVTKSSQYEDWLIEPQESGNWLVYLYPDKDHDGGTWADPDPKQAMIALLRKVVT